MTSCFALEVTYLPHWLRQRVNGTEKFTSVRVTCGQNTQDLTSAFLQCASEFQNGPETYMHAGVAELFRQLQHYRFAFLLGDGQDRNRTGSSQ